MSEQRDTLTQAEYDTLTNQRRVLTQNRLANHVSVAESLLAVLDSPLKETIPDLLAALATLCSMTDPNQSPSWDPSRNPNNETPIPRPQPAWAAHKLDQVDRQLYELAGHIDGWTNRPHDPEQPHTCLNCGRKRGRDDIHCRQCGTQIIPTLRSVTRRCDHCGQPFVPMKSHARYHSEACRKAAHRARTATEETEGANPNR